MQAVLDNPAVLSYTEELRAAVARFHDADDPAAPLPAFVAARLFLLRMLLVERDAAAAATPLRRGCDWRQKSAAA